MSNKPLLAPKGTVWVCVACGDTAHHKHNFGDVSCTLNSVLCYEEKKPNPETGELQYVAVNDSDFDHRSVKA